MILRHPLSDRILKGEIWRTQSVPRLPEREPTPEMLEAHRLWREWVMHEVEQRRRRREAERDADA